MTRHRPRHGDGHASEGGPDGADGTAGVGAEGAQGADAPGSEAAAEAGGAPAVATPTPEQQVAELQDKWLRARAEIENVRRAARQDVDQARRYGAAPALLALVAVLDNLQRALAQAPPGTDEDFLRGLRLTEQQFLTALESNGVTPVPAAPGQPFDANLHRALLTQPSSEVPPGSILHVALPGYRLHDRLLREAHVVVASQPTA
jgi:molecular chaperone GrpE